MADCTRTHEEHLATWQSWRDDCTGPGGCGFGMQDVDQCDRGHPDDGCTFCGACGHRASCGTHDGCPDLTACTLCPGSATYWRWSAGRLQRAAKADHLGYKQEGM